MMESPNSLGVESVHVWRATVTQIASAQLGSWKPVLCAHETERLERIRHPGRQMEYLAARGFVRDVLSRYLACRPHDLRFEADRHGKPRVLDGGNLEFNLSHSGGWLALAVTKARAVGVDIEDAKRDVDLLGLARRYFAENEACHLERLDEGPRREAFFATWTLKEAFVKALGRGLAFALDSFAFEFDGARLRRFHPPASEAGRNWEFHQFSLPTNLHGALVIETSEFPEVQLEFRDWSPH